MNMKKLSLLALLTSIALSGCLFSSYNYNDYGFKPLEEKEMVFSDIEAISVDWINGNIIIEQDNFTKANNVTIQENEEKYPLYYKVDKGELQIKYVKNQTSNSVIQSLSKTLTLNVPSSIKKYEFNTINTKVDVPHFLYADSLDVKMTNGSFNAGGIRIDKTEFDVVNANIVIHNIICRGEYDAENEKTIYYNSEVTIDSVNGNATLGIDEVYGYQVSFHAVNGKYASIYQEEVLYEYSAKKVIIDFDSVNGNLNIVKNKVIQ